MHIPRPLRAPYACLVMGICALVMIEAASARGARNDPTFHGRSYRVVWPTTGEPEGVVVFLHGLSPRPFREEADAIEVLGARAVERGLAVVMPRARKLCANGKKRCWQLNKVDDELAYVDALVDHVEAERRAAFRERHIIGYSHGGFLLGGAVERGLVERYARVGIVAGGPVGDPPQDKPAQGPPLFLEVGSEDKTQWSAMHELFQRLTACPSELYFREVDGGHAITASRISSFLKWFWTTPVSTPSPSSASPSSPTEERALAPRPVSHPVH